MHGQRRGMPYGSKRQRTEANASTQKQTPVHKSTRQRTEANAGAILLASYKPPL